MSMKMKGTGGYVRQHTTPRRAIDKMQGNTQVGIDPVFGRLQRGVVTKVYYPDEEMQGELATRVVPVCDVLLYGSGVLYEAVRVPVLQNRYGLNNVDIWVPRESSQTIKVSGELGTPKSASANPDSSGESGDYLRYDGDHVIVGYLDNDIKQPIILGAVAHPLTKRTLKKADGDVRRIYHAGVLLEIDKNGNVLVDASGGNNQEIDAEGNETPVGGDITLKTVSGKVVKLNVDNNDNYAVLYTELKGWINGPLRDWVVSHKHASAVGPTSNPLEGLTFPDLEGLLAGPSMKSNKILLPDN